MSSNEFRQVIGRKPSSDPRADELRNRNISQSKEDVAVSLDKDELNEEGGKNQNG